LLIIFSLDCKLKEFFLHLTGSHICSSNVYLRQIVNHSLYRFSCQSYPRICIS